MQGEAGWVWIHGCVWGLDVLRRGLWRRRLAAILPQAALSLMVQELLNDHNFLNFQMAYKRY